MFNVKLRKSAIDHYNVAIERYEIVATALNENVGALYKKRELAVKTIEVVELKVNQLANTPKEFDVTIQEMKVEVLNFENKQKEIHKAEVEAKLAAGTSGTGATLSALGLAVATMGPTAAMGVATTFGVASTGTAISALSGAAATNASLAWLGGGALAAGGGGMSAGSALISLAGPVGWTIAGVMLAGSVGSGLFASYKNKETADKLLLERENVEKIIRKFDVMNSEVKSLIEITKQQIAGIINTLKVLDGNDYNLFTSEEKIQIGLLINSTLTLSQLINKEINLND